MAIVPGIYVTLEDRSYVIETPPSGRSMYIVILSDRGEHNKVVEYNSLSEFIQMAGKPSMERTGPAHYMAAAFLTLSNRLYAVRAVLLDSPNPANNCSIANAYIRYNPPGGSEDRVQGKFIYINENDALTEFSDSFVSQYVFANYVGYHDVNVGDFIYNDKDSMDEKLQVIDKGKLENIGTSEINYVYWLKLKSKYQGSTTLDVKAGNKIPIELIGTDPTSLNSYKPNPHNKEGYSKSIKFIHGIKINNNGEYIFTNSSNIVIAKDEASFDAIKQEDWVFPSSGSIENLRQISLKQIDPQTGEKYIVLNDVYNGPTSASPEKIFSYDQFSIHSKKFVKTEKDFDSLSDEVLWYFFAKGAGSYYNNIFIRGNRNINYEKMYVDDNGESLYKYIFIDISVYGENEDGSITLLEGPWTCSLVNTINGMVVRDIFNGRELYITTVINNRSRYINCIDGNAVSIIEGFSEQKNNLRLSLMSLFSDSYVLKTNTRGKNGFYFENGDNGIQYDRFNRLNIYHPEIKQLVRSAYNATLKSVDGSIELLTHTVYPWYYIDYVVSGGYDYDIQSAARELVDSRQDCLLLADLGQYTYNANEDIELRRTHTPWNSFNVALYTQFRQISDPYNFKTINISPVYHALIAHLTVDNKYFISEPVAGIEKGNINDYIKIAYKPSMTDMENLISNELNPTIVERDGTYILTQFTTYKRLSILKRIHAVKFAHFVRKYLPRQLKGLIQRKATPYWIGVAKSLVDNFMRPYTNPNTLRYSITDYSSNIHFDEDRSELYVSISMRFVRAIETIQVNIVTL